MRQIWSVSRHHKKKIYRGAGSYQPMRGENWDTPETWTAVYPSCYHERICRFAAKWCRIAWKLITVSARATPTVPMTDAHRSNYISDENRTQSPSKVDVMRNHHNGDMGDTEWGGRGGRELTAPASWPLYVLCCQRYRYESPKHQK